MSSWICNQCGSKEFDGGSFSEEDFEDDAMSCTNCGGTEFHLTYKRCQFCGQRKPDVATTIDPYDADVNDEKNEVDICEACLDERRADI